MVTAKQVEEKAKEKFEARKVEALSNEYLGHLIETTRLEKELSWRKEKMAEILANPEKHVKYNESGNK